MSEFKSRPARAKVLRSAMLRTGAIERKVIVRDVSDNGARIQTDLELAIGEVVALASQDEPNRDGCVRWVAGQFAGIEFERPMALEEDGVPALARLNRERRVESWISYKHVTMTG